MDMSERGPSTVKEPETKRLKVDNNSKSKVSEIITTNAEHFKEKVHKTKVKYIGLENLPDEILLKIFNDANPKIKELLVFGQVSRRMRSVAYDQSLWQNVNLFRASYFEPHVTPNAKKNPKRVVPTGLLQLILENGCKRMNICSQIEGSLTLNQESLLEFLNLDLSANMDPRILTAILASCHSLRQLRLSNVILNQDMISSICHQNGRTLKVLRLAHCNTTTTEWIQPIIDNCVELSVLDLVDTQLSEESIEHMAKNLTPTISELWLTDGNQGPIKSSAKCEQMIKMLQNRCHNLTELNPLMFNKWLGMRYGIGSQSNVHLKEQNDSKKLEDIVSTFRHYE